MVEATECLKVDSTRRWASGGIRDARLVPRRKLEIRLPGRYCTVCEAETAAEGRRSIVVMHVYFVPLFPVGLHTAWMCPHCVCDINTHRPTHPGTFYVGLACAAIMAAIGVAIAVVTGNREAGSILVLVSAVMLAALVYFMRINRYAEYRENIRRVEPLSGDICPVCGDSLQEGNPPRCVFCDVNVLTN